MSWECTTGKKHIVCLGVFPEGDKVWLSLSFTKQDKEMEIIWWQLCSTFLCSTSLFGLYSRLVQCNRPLKPSSKEIHMCFSYFEANVYRVSWVVTWLSDYFSFSCKDSLLWQGEWLTGDYTVPLPCIARINYSLNAQGKWQIMTDGELCWSSSSERKAGKAGSLALPCTVRK